jgi:hypothetical protein
MTKRQFNDTTINIRLPNILLQQSSQVAQATHISVSSFIRQAIKRHIRFYVNESNMLSMKEQENVII